MFLQAPENSNKKCLTLSQQNQLAHLHEGFGGICDIHRLEAAEVDAAREVGSVPGDGFVAGWLETIDECLTFLSQSVEDF